MTDRIERDARLLCEAEGIHPEDWRWLRRDAERITAAGLTLARIEPDEATVEHIERVGPDGPWPPAISDGLTLTCGLCGAIPMFDYGVTEEAWKALAPDHCRLGVICLPCLDRLATERGMLIGEHLISVQFTGTGHTVVLRPSRVIDYREWKQARAACRAAVEEG